MLAAAWVAYCLLLGCLGIYGAHRLLLVLRYLRSRHAAPPMLAIATEPASELPTVTVQLPLYNEACVAERLIDAVAQLDWPRDRLEIQILDDSTDDTAERCAAKAAALGADGFDIVHVRRRERTGFKAGALAAGLERARGELILVLDADFVPPPALLRDTVGHFADPGVGMVQVRWEHLNRQCSILTRVQALLLDGHFAIEQAARAHTGCFFNFNGTAGIWRRQAIEAAGGWHHDTLTEDLDLSYRALLAGWRFVYLLGHAAPAELPADVNAFKSQQFRWAKGSIQVARKLLPQVMRAPLPARLKLEAFFHLTQNVPYLLTCLLVLLVVPALVIRPGSASDALWVHLPALALTTLTLGTYCAASQRALQRSPWAALAYLPALIGITAGISLSQSRAVVEGLLGHSSEFVRTPKQGMVDSPRDGRRNGPRDGRLDTLRDGLLDGLQDGPAGSTKPRTHRYRGMRDLVAVAELGLAGGFAAALALAVTQERWQVTPILALLCAGFAYVGLRSVLQR